ncbi:MAG: glycosyltransferase family 4 protein, partial [Chloroflexi bacterium]|nr:glycosyltransferase family 4 protein [Chloroflexota bacterium]
MAKFLVIHPNMDIYGGGERVCHHVIKTLVAHGQQVELVAFDFDQNRYSEIMGEKLPENIAVHTLGNRAIVEAKPPLSVYKRRRNILKLLKKYKETAEYDYTFSTQTFSAFEATLLGKAKKNIAYVHFPEIHYDYDHSKRSKRMYLWLYKKLLEKDIGKLDLVFCNSNYTKAMTEKYWGRFGIKNPVVAYPPVEERFWSNKPLTERAKRVLYVGRFVPQKRHELMKKLAVDFPQFEFVSVGLLRDSEASWFEGFSKDLPANYTLKPNLSEEELIKLFQDSQIYCHLMEGEHFGIAPMEALASGCIVLVHNSGGSGEFI